MRNALIAAAAFSIFALSAHADDQARHAFSGSVRRGSIKRVLIDIPAGEIALRNGTRDGISISGEVRRNFERSGDNDKFQSIVDDMTAIITIDGDDAVVERKFGPNASGWSTKNFRTAWRVRVEVPPGMSVDIATKYGEVTVEGDFGDVDVDLRAGEINVRMPRASVKELNASVRVGEVHADFGDQRVSNEGLFPGSTHFYNENGKARVNLHTTAGEVHVRLMR